MPTPVELTIGRRMNEVLGSPDKKAPSLRILFNGQGEGAAQVFKLLLERGHQIVGVVTTKNEDDPLRKLAAEAGLPIVNLGAVNSEKSKEIMQNWKADLGVGFYLQATLNQGVYSIPEYGTINFHLSRLPKRRGRDSMNWGILKGDKKLGASWFLMTKKIDAGPIARQISFDNNGNSQGSQYHEHLDEFIVHTADAVDEMAVGIDKRRKSGKKERLSVVPQIPKNATEDPPLALKHTRVFPERWTVTPILRRVQAGGPGTWFTLINGEKLFIARTSVDTSGIILKPGEMSVVDKGLAIGTKRGVLVAASIGSNGREKIPVHEYISQRGPIEP